MPHERIGSVQSIATCMNEKLQVKVKVNVELYSALLWLHL